MSKNADVQKLKDAKNHLEQVTDADRKAGRHTETPEYLAANSAVIDAEKNVSWWRR